MLEAFGCHVNNMARAIYIFLSLLLAVTTGCGESSKSLEKFLGPAVGETILPSYNLDFDPSVWDFGEVLTSNPVGVSKTFVVRNPNRATLFIKDVYGATSTHYALSNSNCASALVGLKEMETCSFTVTFKPAVAGAHDYNVTVLWGLDPDKDTKQAVINISGIGATPADIVISDAPSYDFGTLAVGANASKTLTLTNNGTYSATSIVGGGLAAPYGFLGGSFPGTGGTCGVTLAGGATCTVVVAIQPTASGSYADTLEVSYSNGQQVVQSTRAFTAVAAAPALLTLNEAPIYDFGTRAVGSTRDHTLTLTNTGGVSAVTVAGAGLGAPYLYPGGVFPGTGGTCAATLASGASCTIVVRYAPTAVGVTNSQLIVNYNNGVAAQSATRDLTGNAVTPAALSISDGATYNFGVVTVGATAEKTFSLTNTGGFEAATIAPVALTAPFSFKGGAFPGDGGDCATSLAAGASCTFVVSFTPTAGGAVSETIRLDFNSGVSAQQATRPIQGAGVTPASLMISGAPVYDFGPRITGSVTEATLSISNSGGTPATSMLALSLTAPFAYKGGVYPGTGGNCGGTLAAAASCSLVITYSPVAVGSHADDLEVSYFDGLNNQTAIRPMTALATVPAVLTISDDPSYDFGTHAIGFPAEKTFTITNIGGFTAGGLLGTGLSAPFNFKGGTFPGTGGTCTATLASSGTCTFVVVYQAVAAVTSNAQISVSYNDGNTNQAVTRDVAGTGLQPANIMISDGPIYDFGPVALTNTVQKTFTLTNVGQVSATTLNGTAFAAPYAFKDGVYPGSSGTCGGSLAAGASCSVVVTFSPTAAGSYNANLEVTYNNGVTSVASTRSIQGVGTTPALLTVSDGPTFIYSSIPYGATASKTFTVTNSGGVAADSMSSAPLTAPFSYAGGVYPGAGGTCAATLAASATCTLVVEYSPVAAGTTSTNIEIAYFNSLANQTASRAIEGTAINPANLTISGGPTYNFGTMAIGGAAEHTFTITNDGQFIATGISGVALPAPFSFKDGTFPGTGGNCGTSLNPATSCTVRVVFAPSVGGLQTANLELSFYNGASTQSSVRPIQGTGATPGLLTISDSPSYNYGTVTTGGSRDKTFVITNTGGFQAATVTGSGLAAPFTFKGGVFPGTGGTCGATIASGANCEVVVTFAPVTNGASTDELVINYNDGVGAQSVSRTLDGNAVSPAQLSISDGPVFNFGAIPNGGLAEKTFTITNIGTTEALTIAPAAMTAPFRFKGAAYPGTGGTCATSLSPGGSCVVVVEFAPTAIGTFSSSLQLGYNDGALNQTATRNIEGVGATPGNLTISDGPTYDFGGVPNGALREYTLTVTNSGGVPVTAIAGPGLLAPFSYKGGGYPGTGGTCSTSLVSGASCTVVIEFAPNALNTFSASLTLNYNDGLVAQASTRSLSGTGIPPGLLSISDDPLYDFGTVAVGGVAERMFSITNIGGFATVSLSGSAVPAPFSYKGGAYPGTGGNCAGSLNVGASCTVVVTFSPTVTGVQAQNFSITYNDGSSPQVASRAVQGTGATPALLAISDGPIYDYGIATIGSNVDKTFTLTNTGAVPATTIAGGGLVAPFGYKGGAFPGTGGTCGGTLAVGASCTVVVTYSPTVLGTQTDAIDISYFNGASNQNATRDVEGDGALPGTLTISDGPTFNFGIGPNTGSLDKTFTITNAGSTTTTSIAGAGLAAPFSFKGGSFPGTGGTCGSSLGPAGTCTLVVTFSPTANGTYTDTIEVNFYDGSANQQAVRPIEGIGAAPATLAVSDGPTMNFGTKATGSNTDHTFSVTNTGGVSATSLIGSGLAAPFSFKGGTFPGTGGTCTATLAAAATCSIVISYAPVATGSQTDTMVLDFNNGVSATSSTRDIEGTGAAPAFLTLSDSPNYNFGSAAVGSSVDKTLTVTNTGGVPAVSLSGAGLAAPFAFKGSSFPGTGGTCSATLAVGASCTVVVSFAPVASGVVSDTAEVTYNDGASAQMVTRDLSGTGVAPALLTVSDGPTYSFGPVAMGSTLDKIFTITNTGDLGATSVAGAALTAPFNYKGGAFPGTGGTCATSLASAGSCTVVVTFSPTALGTFNQALTLNYDNGAASVTSTRPLEGVGVSTALIEISDGPTYDFGNTANGSTVDKSFTLTNNGGVSATGIVGGAMAAPYSFKGGTYPGTGGTCAGTLAATANCTIVVSFSPTALGTNNGSVTVGYNNGVSAVNATRAVTGTSVNPALLTISNGPTYSFGDRPTGSQTDVTLTVTNSGGFAATSIATGAMAAPFTYKGGSFPGTGGTCAATLAVGASCDVVVTWAPTAAGLNSGSANIAYYDGAQNQTASRTVTGNGVNAAVLAINEGPSFSYGTRASGSSTTKSFMLTNTGGYIATSVGGAGLATPYAYAGGSFPGTGGDCSTTLAVGASCTFVVAYAPLVDGVSSDTIEIGYNDGVTTQTATRDVSGTATNPAILTISDGPTFDFGAVPTGASVDKIFTVTNSGDVVASAIAGAALSTPYSYKGGTFPGTGGSCAATLNVGANCTVVLTYSPVATGNSSAILTVNYNNGATGVTATRDVQGVGVAPALITVSDGPTYNFGNTANGATIEKSFILTNSGGVTATSIVGGAIAAPYGFKGGLYPGTGGNCASTLAATATCTVVVTYSPTILGVANGSVSVNYNDGVGAQSASRAVTGTSVNPALLTLSNGPTHSFGTRATGSQVDVTITVTNSGDVAATTVASGVMAAPYTYKGGSFPGTGGTCTATLAVAASCTVVVTWAPTAAGLQSGSANVAYFDGAQNQVAARALEGTGVNPAVLAINEGPSYNYGTHASGSTTTKSFTVTNTGGFDATSVAGAGLAAPYGWAGGTFPGTGGNCTATIAMGASCTFVVAFSPLVGGPSNDTIEIVYNDGAASQTAVRDILGNATSPANLTISDGPTFDFGATPTLSPLEKTFTIANTGSIDAQGVTGLPLTAPFSYKGGTFPGTGGTCGTVILTGANCLVVVSFTPATTGSFNQTLSIEYNDGVIANTATRDMQGVGASPAVLSISNGPTFNFGNVANGGTATRNFIVTNTGGFTATAISGLPLTAPFAYNGSGAFPGGGSCGVSLAAGASCSVRVIVDPNTLGTYNDTLTINYYDGGANQTASRPMTLTAVPPALLTISDGPTYDYGTRAVGSSTNRTFTIANSGGVSASSMTASGLIAPYTFAGGTYPGIGGTCGTNLSAGAQCTIVVNWSPTASGSTSETIEHYYFDGANSVSTTRDVIGNAVTPALLTISDGPTFDFGTKSVGSVTDKTFTMTNSGGSAATTVAGGGISGNYFYKGTTFPGTGGTCGATIAAGASCTFVVTFAPGAGGTLTDTVDIAYNDGAGLQSATRDLTGVGVVPGIISISDGPTYNFGSIAYGAMLDKTFTLTNTGSFPTTSMSGSGLADPFSFKGGTYPGTGGTCGATLNNGDSCTVVVNFAPSVAGTFNDTMNIQFNDGTANQSSGRDIQGVAITPGLLSISDGPTYNFGTHPTSTVHEKVFTVTNIGTQTSTSIVPTAIAAPYSFKGGTYPGTGGDCSTSLTAAASCSIVVVYSPVTTGTHNTNLELAYFDGVTNRTGVRPITGIGSSTAVLVVSDGPTYNFGNVAVAGSTERTFTVTNSGGVSATSISGTGLASPFNFKDSAYPGTGGTCGTTLAVGATCTIVVTFLPTAGGVANDSIELSFHDGISLQTGLRPVTGTGVIPADLVISDGPTYDFGPVAVTDFREKIFTITNSGGVTATALAGAALTAPYAYLGGTFPGTGGTCSGTLNVGASCTVIVRYNPTANGTTNQNLVLNYNDGSGPETSSRAMQGTGTVPSNLVISDGPTFNWGTVVNGGTYERTFTVTNTGGAQATVMAAGALAAPLSFKDGAYPGTGGTCATTLQPTAACTIVVTFSPISLGAVAGTISMTSYDGTGTQTSNRAITATSVGPAVLGFSDGPTYDYGTAAVGAIVDRTFTITNSGPYAASAMASGNMSAPFAYKGGAFPGTGGTCTATLVSGGTCTVVVTYAPTAAGTQSGAAALDYNNGAGPQTATRAVQGTAISPALLTVSNGPTYNYGSRMVNTLGSHTFTVTNSGGLAANSISVTGLDAPYSFKGGTYPGTGGTCGTALAIGASCTLVVDYFPTTGGTHPESLDVSYANGAGTVVASRALTGTGLVPAVMAISDGPSYNFGTVAVTGAMDKTFTISNTGTTTATSVVMSGLSAPINYKGGTFPGVGGNCSTTLAGGASCTVVVTFAPTVGGAVNRTLTIDFNDGVGAQQSTRAISGTGSTVAVVAISDGPSFSFGERAVNSSTNKTFTLTNSGGVPTASLNGSTLTAPFSYAGGTFPGTGGNCTSALAAAGTCTIVVTYAPTAVGSFNETLTISYYDGLANQSTARTISASSSNPSSLTISDGPTFDYGTRSVGSATDKTFTVTNTGSFAASAMAGSGLVAPFVFKGGTYPGTGGTCGTTLAVGATCTVIVTWSPTVTGVQNGTLTINYNDGVAPTTVNRDVVGTGTANAILAVSDGPTYNFGGILTVNTVEKIFTISNSGSFEATSVAGGALSAPYSYKGGTFPGTGGDCGTTIAAGASCTVVVNYAPATRAAHPATLTINYNNGAGMTSATRPMTGTGLGPATITISDGATFNFGPIASTASTNKTFTLTNTGDVAATSISGDSLTAPFSYVGGGAFPGTGGTCGTSLAASGTCTVAVTFNPTAIASYSDTLNINYNTGAANTVSSRPMQGSGAAPAVLAVSDGPTFNYGTAANGGTIEKTFTISNSGGVSATSLSGSAVAAPFFYKGGTFPGTGGTCTATLAAAASCTVVTAFTPPATNTYNETFTFNYTDGLVGQSTSRPVTGSSVAPALLALSDGPTYDYGTHTTGSPTDKTFTVTNNGLLVASAISGNVAAPFAYKGGSFPGTGGNCTATLAVGASCTIVVTYTPASTGVHNQNVNVTYNNGASATSASVGVTGVGAAPAVLAISDGATFNFGNVMTTSSVDKTFTVSNSGGTAAASMAGSGLAAPFSFKGGTYPGTGGTCSTSLAIGANCTIVVTYAPTANGLLSDTIDVTYNNGVSAQTAQRPVQGTGVGPASLTISDGATFNFGTIASTASLDKVFTVTNGGGVSATSIASSAIYAPFAYKGGSFPGTGGNCGSTLAAGTSCTYVVTFNPTVNGVYNDTVQIDYNTGAANTNTARPITGTGADPAVLTISDGATFDYGIIARGGVAEKVFTVSNGGGVAASSVTGAAFSAPFAFKGGSFPGTGGTCAASLAAATSCSVVVTYNPTVNGTQNATFTVNYYNGLGAQSATRAITGTANNPANLTISNGPTYDLGSLTIGSSLDATLTITNDGENSAASMAGVGLSAPIVFKGGTYPGTGGTCTTSLAASASCTVVVTWSPTATGAQSRTMQINYNNGASNVSSTRTIQGTGSSTATITISDGATFNFGTVALNQSVEKSFTLTNTGGAQATAMSGGGLAAPFVFKGGTYPGTDGTCTTTLNAGANCTIVVVYTPTATGLLSDTIEISFNNGVTNTTSNRAIQGTGAAVALLATVDAPNYDFGARVTNVATDRVVTISNSGGVAATGISGAGLAAPFTFKGGAYPGTGGTCTTSLAVGANCTVVITFTPTAAGPHSDTVEISYTNGPTGAMLSWNVQGVGTSAALLAISNGPTYSFGTLVAGQTAEVTLTVDNSGGVSATSVSAAALPAPFAFKGGSFPGTGGTCAATLAAAANCTLVVTYSPTSANTHNATLTLNYNDGGASTNATRAITGVATAPATIAISDGPTYSFGNQPLTAVVEKVFTLTHTGASDATSVAGGALSAPFSYKGGSFPGTGGTCTATLASGQTCTVVVLYSPTVAGSHSGTLTVNYNDGAAARSATRGVAGVGQTVSLLTVSDGATYNYGNVVLGASVDKTFTVTNSGGFAASGMSGSSLAAPYSFKGGSYPGTGGSCSTTLAGGASCSVVVTFSPTIAAVHNATLEIGYNNGLSAQTVARAMTGTGYSQATLEFTVAGLYDYTSKELGTTTAALFNITNSGAVTATSMAGAAFSDAAFAYTGGSYPGMNGTCGTTLPASSTCSVEVRFLPTTTGLKSSTLTINYNDGAGAQSVAKTLQGTGANVIAPTALTRLEPAASPGTDNTVKIQVAGVAEGDTVSLHTNSGCSAQVASGVVGAAQTTIDLTSTALGADGSYTFYARRTNPGGSTSACSTATATYTLDTTPPVISGLANQSPGVSPHYTSAPTIRVSGTFSNDTVRVYSDASCADLLATANAVTGANVDVVLPDLGSDGQYTFYARATDSLNNQSACSATSVTYILDATNADVTLGSHYQYKAEGSGTVTIPVTMSSSKMFDAIINYRTSGTAVVGTHISGISGTGTVTIPAGQTTANITFTVPDNGLTEKEKYLDVVLVDSNYPYVSVAGILSHRVVITDNDQAVSAPLAMPSGIGSGYNVACYINSAGKLFCMGRGGMVGDGTSSDRTGYVAVDAANNYSHVSVGYEHGCAITSGGVDAAGTVKCWGMNSRGQLGDGTTTASNGPVSITTGIGTGAKAISAGAYHTCAISSSDSLWCWGANDNQQAVGAAAPAGDQTSPVNFDNATGYLAIAAGFDHNCGITASNQLTCFGSNANGKTGAGTSSGSRDAGLISDSGVSYTKIAVNADHSCGITSSNAMKCWGSNARGRAGLGGTGSTSTPTLVDSGVSYSAVATGNESTCGITTGNALKCTGRGDQGAQLDLVVNDRTSMQVVQSGTNFSAVTAGFNGTWARTSTNSVLYGGFRTLFSFIGDGKSSASRATAVQFDGTRVFSSIDNGFGSQYATCAISNGKLRCVGHPDASGFFGLGSNPDATGLVWVDSVNSYSAVASGRKHMCAIGTDNKLYCAGDGSVSGVGANANVLTTVDGTQNYAFIAVGRDTTCGILSSGTLKCWGENAHSQVGNNSTVTVATPTVIDSGVSYSKVAVGVHHACGITTSGSALKCWGRQLNGRLGNGLTAEANVGSPTVIDSGTGYSEIAVGDQHTCGVTTSGVMKCWGLNTDGRLGDGTTMTRATPVTVDSGNTYTKVAVGDFNSCGIRSTGKIHCWGSFSQGIVGTALADVLTPTVVDSASSFTDLEIGRTKLCGLTTTNRVRCWGNNQYNAFADSNRFWLPRAIPAVGFTQND